MQSNTSKKTMRKCNSHKNQARLPILNSKTKSATCTSKEEKQLKQNQLNRNCGLKRLHLQRYYCNTRTDTRMHSKSWPKTNVILHQKDTTEQCKYQITYARFFGTKNISMEYRSQKTCHIFLKKIYGLEKTPQLPHFTETKIANVFYAVQISDKIIANCSQKLQIL